MANIPSSASSPVPAGGEAQVMPNPNAPMGSPASNPVIPAGLNEAAKAQIGVAAKLLMQVLPHLTDQSEQNEVLGVISRLNRKFGSVKSGEIEDAQLIKLLRENAAGAQQAGAPPAPASNPYGG